MLQFKDLDLEDKTLFEAFTLCHGYHNIEASFTNNFIWRKAWNTRIASDDEALYLLLNSHKSEPYVLTPFLDNCDNNIGSALRKCEEYLKAKFDSPLLVRGITEKVKEKIENDCPGEYTFTLNRSCFDYVYRSEDLAMLKGKKYHAKRNYINRLLKSHTFEYKRYSHEYYDACVALHDQWIKNKGEYTAGYADEFAVIKEALLNVGTLNLKCGLLFVDDQLEAFSIGEKFVDDMVIVHIEKANPDLDGAFALINREFVRHEWSDVTYINREEDMGIEGLRKAKLSYHPAYMIEKYYCVRRS